MTESKKNRPLREKYLGIDSIIYTMPFPVDEKPMEHKGYGHSYLDNKKLTVDVSNYSPLEMAFALVIFAIFFYMFFYKPLSTYFTLMEYVPEHAHLKRSQIWDEAKRYVYAYNSYGIDGLKRYLTEDFPPFFFLGSLACGMIGYWFYVAAKRCRDKVTFNRETSMVTYRHTFGFITTTALFSEVLFQPRMMSLYSLDYMLGLRLPGTVSWAVLSFGYPYEYVSRYVWYMDKNRPLPPGDAFDQYREEDYLRRREEGFPMPQYHSAIPTPEWEGAKEKYDDNQGDIRARYLLHEELVGVTKINWTRKMGKKKKKK